jgi:hypothetical protein
MQKKKHTEKQSKTHGIGVSSFFSGASQGENNIQRLFRTNRLCNSEVNKKTERRPRVKVN